MCIFHVCVCGWSVTHACGWVYVCVGVCVLLLLERGVCLCVCVCVCVCVCMFVYMNRNVHSLDTLQRLHQLCLLIWGHPGKHCAMEHQLSINQTHQEVQRLHTTSECGRLEQW